MNKIQFSRLISLTVIFFSALLLAAAQPITAKELPRANPPRTELSFSNASIIMNLTVLGPPLASKEQCLSYLLKQNPMPLLTVSPKELVDYYYTESIREGVRPDVAFAQALHETGNFRYGGDVIPIQNNYCGLGTVGGGVKGAFFPTAEIGVRAQIQHLLAYATKRAPSMPIVDPRYQLVKRGANFGKCPTWTSLNGRWAVPGKTYGQKILTIHRKILAENPIKK